MARRRSQSPKRDPRRNSLRRSSSKGDAPKTDVLPKDDEVQDDALLDRTPAFKRTRSPEGETGTGTATAAAAGDRDTSQTRERETRPAPLPEIEGVEFRGDRKVIFTENSRDEYDLTNPDDIDLLADEIKFSRNPDFVPQVAQALEALGVEAAVYTALGLDPGPAAVVRRWRTNGNSRRIIESLEAAVQDIPIPPGHIGLWRFHSNPAEYQSHRYQNAQAAGAAVNDADLAAFRASEVMQGQHMFHSSGQSNSAGVSFAVSLDQIVSASQGVVGGGDAHLRRTIEGTAGNPGEAATLLSYAVVNQAELVRPDAINIERVFQPEIAAGRITATAVGSMGTKKHNAMNESEVLHIPGPGTGGRTIDPARTFRNPFPQTFTLAGTDAPQIQIV